MSATRAALGRSSVASAVARPIWEQDVSWQDLGECRGADVDLFFPPQIPESKDERGAREGQAKAICARCPVRARCLDYAIATREPYGIWGGLNETERRQHVARQRQAG